MMEDTQIQAVEKLLVPLLTEDVFLVSIKIKPTNNFKIFLDADNGLSIEKCIKINRALYRQMEEKGKSPPPTAGELIRAGAPVLDSGTHLTDAL